ncbi:MAG: hypothetical protein P8Y69_06480 [Gammaproteobacteria bacterium]
MARAKPNLDWLPKARKALNEDPAFRKLGSTDVTLGLRLGEETRLVKFEAFEVAEIVEDGDLRDANLVLDMTPKDWNAYLRQRARGKGPSLLSLDLDQGVFETSSPVDRLMLPRYNLSLQAFIDAGARLSA